MRTDLLLFISAARDMRIERDVIAKAVTEIPTSLGWTIKQTPPPNRESDLVAVARADAHLLLLGRDIQAPVGLEWATALRADKHAHLFAQDVTQTQAATAFMRETARHAVWTRFKDAHDLRLRALRLLGDLLLARTDAYGLSADERKRLTDWRASISGKKLDDARAADDSGGQILTIERFMPRDGKAL